MTDCEKHLATCKGRDRMWYRSIRSASRVPEQFSMYVLSEVEIYYSFSQPPTVREYELVYALAPLIAFPMRPGGPFHCLGDKALDLHEHHRMNSNMIAHTPHLCLFLV